MSHNFCYFLFQMQCFIFFNITFNKDSRLNNVLKKGHSRLGKIKDNSKVFQSASHATTLQFIDRIEEPPFQTIDRIEVPTLPDDFKKLPRRMWCGR